MLQRGTTTFFSSGSCDGAALWRVSCCCCGGDDAFETAGAGAASEVDAGDAVTGAAVGTSAVSAAGVAASGTGTGAAIGVAAAGGGGRAAEVEGRDVDDDDAGELIFGRDSSIIVVSEMCSTQKELWLVAMGARLLVDNHIVMVFGQLNL